jgi:putative FmdB family regulatory protein
MPVYVYRCDDGSTFEIEQRMTADALLICPTTGQRVVRVLQPFSPRYTGTGFYSTDHRKPNGDDSTSGSARGGTAQSAVSPAEDASVPSGSSSVKV